MDECKPLGGGAHQQPLCGARSGQRSGRAVHVDPVKPKLKAPCTNLLKLEQEKLLLKLPFNYNLRHYNLATAHSKRTGEVKRRMAGAYTRSHFRST